ncbi:MAG: pyridoxal phosphate-dependent aminotransferase [Muribaculum sp.]|nr:pyridoxal phosphate-dependent aminotransferase [Muribaculum sp.]
MGKYNFDCIIDRHGSGAIKVDALDEFFGRHDLLPLWIADMDFAVAPDICNALIERMKHPIYGYATVPTSYWQSIMSWLERRHGWRIRREALTYVPGVVKAIGYAINHFTAPGESILIQTPVYHPFQRLILGNNRIVVKNPLIFDEKNRTYRMDFDDLEAKMRDAHPRMMILCNPHNPAGLQWDAETLRRVAALAKKYRVVVVSDEIHGDLMLRGERHIPFATVSEEAAEVAVTFGAPSKTFNIAGLVSSWCVVTNPDLRKPFFDWLEVNEFSSPTFVATLGTETAYNYGEEWLNEALEYIAGTFDMVENFLAEKLPAIRMIKSNASFLAWLDCRDLGMTHQELIELFVDKAHLALNDGAMFGTEGEKFMRLNLGSPRSVIQTALQTLADNIGYSRS